MLLTQENIAYLASIIEKARVAAVDGSPLRCSTPHKGEDGKTYRVERKPSLSEGHIGKKLGNLTVKKGEDGKPELHIPLGEHGRAFLAVDTKDNSIWCAKCKKKLGTLET